MIDRGIFFFKEAPHLFQNFVNGDIFFSDEGLFRGLPDLAIDAVVSADFVWNKINSEGPSQPSGRHRTVKILVPFHQTFNSAITVLSKMPWMD
jgi:hypothetical protein